MNFIRELVLEKIVPLGFSYNEIMLVVQRKIKKEKWKTKRDVYQFFVSFLSQNRDSQAVRNFLFRYKYIFQDKNQKFKISYTKNDEDAFYKLLFWEYLVHGVEKQKIETQYQSYLALQYSNRKYLERKYASYYDFLTRAISCLNWEDQLKLKQIYHISTVAPIENKILYYFRYFFLERVLGVSFSFQQMGDITAGYLYYFEKILKQKNMNINQYYQLLQKGILKEKIVLDFFVEKSFDVTIPIETYEQILSDVLEHQQLEGLRYFKTGLFTKFSDVSEKYVLDAVEFLQKNYVSFYEIIDKRYGEDLTEWHSLNNYDNALYNNALNRLRLLLKRRDCYRKAKELLIEHKNILPVIKMLRRGLSIESVCEKYSYSVGELFDILSNNLLLFDSGTLKNVLRSFFLYHQQDKLLQSKQYWFLLQCYPNNFKGYKQDILARLRQAEEDVTFNVDNFALKKIPKEFLIHKNGS